MFESDFWTKAALSWVDFLLTTIELELWICFGPVRVLTLFDDNFDYTLILIDLSDDSSSDILSTSGVEEESFSDVKVSLDPTGFTFCIK